MEFARVNQEEFDEEVRRIIRYNISIYGFNGIMPAQNMAIDIAGMVKKVAREFYLQKTDK